MLLIKRLGVGIAAFAVLATLFSNVSSAEAGGLGGRILLRVEGGGELWYYNADDGKRYHLRTPAEAAEIFDLSAREVSLATLQKIPASNETGRGVMRIRRKYSGKILVQNDNDNEIFWYVYPVNLKRYYYDGTAASFQMLARLALGVKDSFLVPIPVGQVIRYDDGPVMPPPPRGCAYQNPDCRADQECVNNLCIQKTGCRYNNPSCSAGQFCGADNLCRTDYNNPPRGCAYGTMTCALDEECRNNSCVRREGCRYNNPICPNNTTCASDNTCRPTCALMSCSNGFYCANTSEGGRCLTYPQPPYGCFYNNLLCAWNEECRSNTCVKKSGCLYDYQGCPANHTCTSENICRPTCSIISCASGYSCVNNGNGGKCVQDTPPPTPTGCAYRNPDCAWDQDCIGNICTRKTGCNYANPVCRDDEDCVNNRCLLKRGCAYGNPLCRANEQCVNNNCIARPVGCAYNNPACASNEQCVGNTCVLRSGCAYNNPSCGASEICVNNACVRRAGCAYNNPACAANQQCVNNTCVALAGCRYNNPSCPSGQTCSNNQCITAPTGCAATTCGAGLRCVDNGRCVTDTRRGCAANRTVCAANETCVNDFCLAPASCSDPTIICPTGTSCLNNRCVFFPTR